MNFDGLFELVIDILVGIEYLNVKIGWKLWFLQFFFLAYFTTILLQIKMAKFRKKSLNFGSGQQNCFSFLHAT